MMNQLQWMVNRQMQMEGQIVKERIDPLNFEVNYNEQYVDYDFDPEDRPCVYPNDSFAKHIFPPNKTFNNIYGKEGQGFDPDWTSAACTNFMGQCENKHKKPLYQVKWMKDGQKVVTSSNQG